MSKKLPNFLIVGAAKCGTSSLNKYLDQHPQIFMSKVKEPRFITSQVNPFPLNGPGDHKVEAWYVKKYEDYVKLFEGAENYQAVGEASADTLYFYKGSIPVIKQYLGDPKIIIMLRNPVKRAFSAYQHLVRDLREDLSFEEGLKQEPERIRNNWELIYHYTAVSMYHDSVKAFLDNFSNVKIILTEDQEKRPQQVIRDLFRFLEVNPDCDVNTEIRYNISGKPKSQWIHQFFFEGNMARNLARPIARTLFSQETRLRISQKIQEKNLTRLTINPDTKETLQGYFEEDIQKLEKLLGRDLSLWRK
ncbi:MAG TPA: sulfotransferase [Chryseosolibacter sp.]|nr:sulfotransferase [Chryseosolibacter sp.]